MQSHKIPFCREQQLCDHLSLDKGDLEVKDGRHYLPGCPWISLDDDEVLPFVTKDLLTPLLDDMSPWLWLVATPKSTHVAALNAQRVRGRNIVITEDPELHLVWIHNKIHIKPLPKYIMCHAFWSHFLKPDRKLTTLDQQRRTMILKAALGYVRTYLHLIRHESDWRIAQNEHLVPDDIDFDAWASFIKGLRHVEDRHVSGRYKYGDLRLSRLNFWATPLLGRWHFRKAAWQYSDYFARYLAPLLFIFTTWSLILDSMQVGLASRPNWERFTDVSAWFSVTTLVGVVAVAAFLLGVFCILAGREILYAVRQKTRRNAQSQKSQISDLEMPYVQ